MNTKFFSALIAIGLAFIGVIADSFIKKAGIGSSYIDVKWFLAGLITYALTAIGWFYVLKTLKLSTVGVLYGISSVLLLTLAGMFFGEHLKPIEWVGIVLAITSIILLSRFA